MGVWRLEYGRRKVQSTITLDRGGAEMVPGRPVFLLDYGKLTMDRELTTEPVSIFTPPPSFPVRPHRSRHKRNTRKIGNPPNALNLSLHSNPFGAVAATVFVESPSLLLGFWLAG